VPKPRFDASSEGCLRGARILPTGRTRPHPRTAEGREEFVKLLRRLLKMQAALWLMWSVAVGLVPRRVLEDLFGQPVLADYVWVTPPEAWSLSTGIDTTSPIGCT
jgi:hypothetical protein